jgi:hypothetical protein
LKKKLIFLFINHFIIALKRNNLLFNYILKKTINIIGASLFILVLFYVIKVLNEKNISIDNLEKNFYFVVGFFWAILNSVSKTSPLTKNMKEYLLLPFSLNEISLTIILLSLFEIDRILYYLYILIIGSFIEVNLFQLITYLFSIQMLFSFNIIYFNKMIFLVVSNIVIGYISFQVVNLICLNNLFNQIIMFIVPFFLFYIIYRILKNKFNFKNTLYV